MKKSLLAGAIAVAMIGSVVAEDVKIGILLGFTGPLESITPMMAAGAELAIKEVNAAGGVLGNKVVPVRADSTCADAAAATAAAERLVTVDKINGLVGADCSGATTAVLQNVTKPNGIVQISPSSTSPALSTIDSDGFFFRTAPSDARQGEIMADIIKGKNINKVALTYTNNDYGKGLASAFAEAFKKAGGTITINASHEDGKADYSSEVAALAAAGGEVLVVAGYTDQGGRGIIRASLDTGAFSKFVLPDGMYGDALIADIGKGLEGSFGQLAGTDSKGAEIFVDMAKKDGFDGTSSYTGEDYDAAALIMLAMTSAKSTDPKVYKSHIIKIANGTGEKIIPGQLGKALDLIKAGKEIDYVGATDVHLVGNGESAGKFREVVIKDGKWVTVGYH